MPLSDIGITKENDICINLLKEKGYFGDDKTAAQFATSYALKNINLHSFFPIESYNKGNFTNNKWHTEDFDSGAFFRSLIRLYYEDISDSDYALRAVISLGLDEVYKRIKDHREWSILDLL